MKIKKGDNVIVIAGKDKGKEGKVLSVDVKNHRVLVEGVNIVKKHSKPTNTNDKGGIFDIEAPIHVSNVKVVDAKAAKKEEKKAPAKKEAAKKTTKKASK